MIYLQDINGILLGENDLIRCTLGVPWIDIVQQASRLPKGVDYLDGVSYNSKAPKPVVDRLEWRSHGKID